MAKPKVEPRYGSRGELKRLYVVEGLTMREIGARYGVSAAAVSLWMKAERIGSRGARKPRARGVCGFCGEEFEWLPSSISSGKERRFCSRACRAKSRVVFLPLDEIREMYEGRGWSVVRIANTLDVSWDVALRELKRAGVTLRPFFKDRPEPTEDSPSSPAPG